MQTHLPTGLLALCLLALPVLTVLGGGFPAADKLPAHDGLPDPLTMLDGKRVTTKEQWTKLRRPELKELFQHYMYGYAPAAPKVVAKVDRVDPKALGGKATLKEITLTLGDTGAQLRLLLVVPNQRTGPAPVFVGLNFAGNHAVLDDPKIHLNTNWLYPNYPGVKDNRATEASRGSQKDVWCVEDAIDRGYAVATVYCGDIDPDRPDVRDGVQKFFARPGASGPTDWGTVAAWAWGIQRVIDYLVTLPEIDAGRIVVVGHSRLGKATLLAGALDERIAVVIPHQAGCGGTAPSRGRVGESVKQINERFPHWFNGEFKKFNTQTERLPFDQHCLVALCAPRPVLFSNAVEDQWANPDGQFEMLKAADPVYRLLDAGGLDAKQVPPVGKLLDGTLGYYLRDGKHSMNRADWRAFLAFADQHLSAKAK